MCTEKSKFCPHRKELNEREKYKILLQYYSMEHGMQAKIAQLKGDVRELKFEVLKVGSEKDELLWNHIRRDNRRETTNLVVGEISLFDFVLLDDRLSRGFWGKLGFFGEVLCGEQILCVSF